ncbi:hypothetical protein DPMN_090786 [Dreissena polymorpha]|uniref:Uncharacterized protein n=1 Tax=Dreissena polymorpha TaxID=45954 RepID=A0A9D4KYD7_DREPO|nr:hypothetical protein DPMN_090786 [Dreissena polymorpha]
MEVAMLLLDSYDAYKVMLRRKKQEPLAKSTPQKPETQETQEEKILHGESSEPVSITGQSEISGLHPISSKPFRDQLCLSLSSSVDSSNDEENSDEDYEPSSDICMRFCQSFNKKVPGGQNEFQLRLLADKPLSTVLGLAKSDPRRISRNIAPVEPPSKKELIEQFKSRYSKNY